MLTASVYRQRHKVGYGVFELEKDKVVGYKEKPNYRFPVAAGTFIYEKKVLTFIKKNEYLNFPDLMHLLIKRGEKIALCQVKGICIDIGGQENYQKAIRGYLKNPSLFLSVSP